MGFLAVSHRYLSGGYGSFFIVKIEFLYKFIADSLKSDDTTPCQEMQMRLDPTLRDTHTVPSTEIAERGACGEAGFDLDSLSGPGMIEMLKND